MLINRKMEILSFSLLLAFSIFADILSYTPSRDYPAIKSSALDFRDGMFANTQIFSTFCDPIIEEVIGDQVINPWAEYNIWDLNNSLQEFQKAAGTKPVDYLKGSYILNNLGAQLPFDMELKRDTSGPELEVGCISRNIFENMSFEQHGNFAERNRSLLKDVDFFCNISTSFMKAVSEGEYFPGSVLLRQITNPNDPDMSRYPGVTRAALVEALQSARRKMQETLDSEAYFVEQAGFTDLVAKLGLKKRFHHAFRCRRIDLYSGLIITFPFGQVADPNKVLSFNFGYPVTTFGLTTGLDILLKRDLSAGLGFLWNFGYEAEELRRVSIGKEPAALSPLKSRVTCVVGQTYTINPYVQWKNVFTDRLDARISFVHTRHLGDKLFQLSNTYGTPSPIVRAGVPFSNSLLDTKQAMEVLQKAEKYTCWKTNFLELKMNYRTGSLADAESNKTNIFFAYQRPFDPENAIKHHRFTVGASINF